MRVEEMSDHELHVEIVTNVICTVIGILAIAVAVVLEAIYL